MQVFETIAGIREFVDAKKKAGGTVGFVPTMGYLHEGHISLVRAAKKECDAVVVSIFVNPMQFGPKEDFNRYPRDLQRDSEMLRECGADALFCPPDEEMYPEGFKSYVDLTAGLSDCLCGASRPGHFRGVATVVTKLFNIVQAHRAYFGQKDYQQLLVIRRVARDLNIPVEVVAVPTKREADGLAMSSRNVYLSPEQRAAAPVLFRSLQKAAAVVSAGEKDTARLTAMVRDEISSLEGVDIDYIEIRSLPELREIEKVEKPSLLALAVKFGATRLIDNIVLGV